MTLVIPNPPAAAEDCFARAMVSLASHPDRPKRNENYEYLPPLRRYVLEEGAARSGDFRDAEPVGWRYLVRDDNGLMVVDLDDDFDLTYSSVQRGTAAQRYEAVLRLVDNDAREWYEDCGVEVVESPELGASALVLTVRGIRFLFALTSKGRFQPGEKLTEEAFYEVVLEPSPPPPRAARPSRDGGLII
ncbi:hypothetical protein HFO33_32540 [Rhizobium leguminosarum]|uniref:hypothetical protein n=1 Tax=Rhizobium leguminosarum TaxID=384 RepID=UPI001C954196|nr:hypothetical protein [Rhizobium leguminosarum]MBY5721234.1 hypothetical protein [Rhizobium leguminosarum]